MSHLRHLTRAGKPDNVWVLQELHDVEFSRQVFRVGIRVIAGLERLNRHLPAVPVATAAATTSQFTAETAFVGRFLRQKEKRQKSAPDMARPKSALTKTSLSDCCSTAVTNK